MLSLAERGTDMTSSTECRYRAAAERYAATVAIDDASNARHLRSAEEWDRLARKLDEDRHGRATSKRLLDETYFSERIREES